MSLPAVVTCCVLVSEHCWPIGDQCLLLLLTRVECELFPSCFHNALEWVQCLVWWGRVGLFGGLTPYMLGDEGDVNESHVFCEAV